MPSESNGAKDASKSDNVIEFIASVYKVQTLVDGGIRIALDLPETDLLAMAMLAECQIRGKVISATCMVLNYETEKIAKGSGSEMGSRRIGKQRDQLAGQ